MKLAFLEKIKNLSMRTKRVIALVICLSLLAIAILQNMEMDRAEAGNKGGDDNVDVSIGGSNIIDENQPESVGTGVIKVDNTEEYFATVRLNRLNERSETEESCNEIIDSETSGESAVADAVARIESLKQLEKMETNVETTVKARGYSDVFVIIENDSVYITVQSESLDSNEASAIAISACEITGYSMDDVVLKGVY